MSGNRCDSCGADIRWLKTTAGKWMPVNAGTVSPTDTLFDGTKHVTHFSTCPNSDKHRKPRR